MARNKSPFVKFMDGLDRVLIRIESVTVAAAGLALFAMMALIFFDALLRYTLNSPLTFSSDLVTLYLISAAMFLTLAQTLRHGGHVTVDIFAHILPRSLHHILMGLALSCSVVVVGLMGWEVLQHTWESYSTNEVTVGLYAWPIWVSKAIVGVSIAALEIRLVHAAGTNLAAGLLRDPAIALHIVPEKDQSGEEAI